LAHHDRHISLYVQDLEDRLIGALKYQTRVRSTSLVGQVRVLLVCWHHMILFNFLALFKMSFSTFAPLLVDAGAGGGQCVRASRDVADFPTI
jgi:hypothetical protein